MSLINDILLPLMNASVDYTNMISDVGVNDLNRIRDEVLNNIDIAIQGQNDDVNITAELIRFFTEGLSGYYYNFTFTGADQDEECRNAIYNALFPPVEQAKISSLGRNLEQIKVVYDVIRAVSIYSLLCMYTESSVIVY